MFLFSKRGFKLQNWNIFLCLVFVVPTVLSLSQSIEAQQSPDQTGATAGEQSRRSKSGFEDVPQFGGPNSVGATLSEDDEVSKPWFRLEGIDKALKPWFDWKGRLNKNYGLSFGLDYTALGQGVSDSPG
jgi:hypothetical protein